MAGRTRLPGENTSMIDRVTVTTGTFLGSSVINIIDMTISAQNGDMGASQFKNREIMVKTCIRPGLGGMARVAILT
jgi:hypothetical protein